MIPLSPDEHYKCRSCGGVKHWSEFTVSNKATNDLTTQCKLCQRTYRLAWNRSPRGNAIKMWHDMNYRAENKDGKHSTYKNVKVLWTREAFLAWAEPRIKDFL